MIKRYKYLLQNTALVIILLTFFILYGCADYSAATKPFGNVWDKRYYVSEAWAFAFFALVITQKTRVQNYRVSWGLLALFLVIRAVWEITAVLYGMNVNEKIVVAILFYMISAAIFYVTFLPYLKKYFRKLTLYLNKT